MSAPVLQLRLTELRLAIRRVLAWEGLAAVAVALLAAVAATFLLDWTLRLDPAPRGVVSLLALAGICAVGWRQLVRPFARPLSDLDLALILEKHFPQLEDRFVTTVEMASSAHAGISEQLVAAVVLQAEEAAQQISPHQTLDQARLRRWLLAGGGAMGMMALAGVIFPTTMKIWFQRDVLLRDVAWPQATYLTVAGFTSDKPMRVMRGGTLEIVVEASGRKIPETVRLEMQFSSSGRFREELGTSGPHRFTRQLEGVVEPFRFWVSGGDATTPAYAVELVEPPVLSEVKFRAVYPEYTGLTARTFGLGEGNLEVPVGTMLELTALTSKSLKGGKVFYGDKEAGAIKVLEKNRVSTRLFIAQSGRLRVALEDAEGFTSEAAFTYPVFALPDRAPVLRLAVTGVGERVTKVATVPFSIEARDDYGVTALTLRFGKTDLAKGASQTLALHDVTLPARLARFDHVWPIETAGLTEGDTLQFRVEAQDAAAVPVGGNHAESNLFTVRIVSAAELMEELQRRQKALRIEFERMTQRQREVVDATKLLRDRVEAGLGNVAAVVADERDLGNGCQNQSEQFARILTEMRNNRVSTEGDYQRLEFRIVGPMREVAQALLTNVATELERIRPADGPDAILTKLTAQVEEQNRLHEQMVVILADMVKGETLADAISLLREILANQKNLNAATKKRLEDEINKLLGGAPK